MKNSLANVQARRADIERLVDRHGIATVKGLHFGSRFPKSRSGGT